VIFGALMGAIAWNLITWRLGIPSSSSHALIGGLLGSGMAKAGAGATVWTGIAKTGAAIVLSPLLGFLLALLRSWWCPGRSCARRRRRRPQLPLAPVRLRRAVLTGARR
jgi:PiT family inorganic phosphate transporter